MTMATSCTLAFDQPRAKVKARQVMIMINAKYIFIFSFPSGSLMQPLGNYYISLPCLQGKKYYYFPLAFSHLAKASN
jgi:hypothetical protein